MSVLIDVTPSVHEKFKNYKESSTFRDKTDAELLEYFLDSFEVITCIVELGARTTAAPSGNPSVTTVDLTADPTSSSNRQPPSIAYVQPFAAALQHHGTHSSPSSRILPNARKSTPTAPQNTIPTTSSRLNSRRTNPSQTSPKAARKSTTPVQSARKSTPSSVKAKKSTSTSPSTCTRTQPAAENSSSAHEESAALEYAKNWRASILKQRSPRISPGSSSTRRKSTQNSAVSRKPPPLAISPMPAVKTEPVDPADVIEQAMSVPLATVLDKIKARQVSPRNQPSSQTIPPADNGDATDQGDNTESYDADTIKQTLKLQSKSKRKKTLAEKAKDLYDFDTSTSVCNSTPRPVVSSSSNRQTTPLSTRLNSKSVAQLLFEAAFHTPTSSPGSVPSSTSSSSSPNTPNQTLNTVARTPNSISQTSNTVNIPSCEPISLQGLLASSTSDHSYSKTRRSAPASQVKANSNKPFILTIKPVRGSDPDVASAISSGKPLSPQHALNSVPLRSNSHATKSTAPIDSSRSHSVSGDSMQSCIPAAAGQIACSVCCRAFETKADFERHIKTVSTSKEFDPLTHKRINSLSATSDLPGSETSKFCRLCKTAFISRQALENHLANGCTIFPGLETSTKRPHRLEKDSGFSQQKSVENVIRIFNVSQASSPQNRSSKAPNNVPEHQVSLKRSLPETPSQPVPKRRPQSELFSLTCTTCNQKFCECLISSRKYKSNYKKKSAEKSPKTDPFNFPFPFDLDAVRAPDGKENASHSANNLKLFNSSSVSTPVVSKSRSPPRVTESESLAESLQKSGNPAVSADKMPSTVSDGTDSKPNPDQPTESCKLLQQLESAIVNSKQKVPSPNPATLSFEEARYLELQLSSEANTPTDRCVSQTGPEGDPKESPATAEILPQSLPNKLDTGNQSCTVKEKVKTSAVLRYCCLEDDDENIASETEPVRENIDTDDECGFSDSEKFDEVSEVSFDSEKTKAVAADIVGDPDSPNIDIRSSQNRAEEDRVKAKGPLSKLIDDETGTIDSASDADAHDFVTDDELDFASTDSAQESSHDVLIALNNFDELLRRHKLYDEKLASYQDEEGDCNLYIADDDTDNDDGLSVSSGSLQDFCLDSDDECSLSDFDLTMASGDCEPYSLLSSGSTTIQDGLAPLSLKSSLVDSAARSNEVGYPIYHDSQNKCKVIGGRTGSKRLKAKALSIDVRDSYLCGAPSPSSKLSKRKKWTWSRDKQLFCGPCHKHFKTVNSLEKHELEYHSISQESLNQ